MGELGILVWAGKILKGAGHWLLELDAIHALALILGVVCLWQFVTIHGIEFKLIPGIGPKIHIVSLKGQRDDARSQRDKALADLATSEKNEATLRAQIGDQNKRIALLSDTSSKEQSAAAKKLAQELKRIDAANAVAKRLRDSAAHPRPGVNCEPSAALKKQWQ